MEKTIYSQMLQRTGGDVYIGVVGPVRTGKSTLVKRIMETLVIPNISDPYRQERARDELPQSGSGKTITTAEPKFVPEEAVEISPDGVSKLRMRLIDSVGYMVPGALGATENGQERMVTTPWFDQELPMSQAAQLGTQKVMAEHCSLGLVVTTDGSVTGIPRQDYIPAERQAIEDMKATGKPFLVLVNTQDPNSPAAREVCQELEEEYGVHAVVANGKTLTVADITQLLHQVLLTFPMTRLEVHLPRWMDVLEYTHPVKEQICKTLMEQAKAITALNQVPSALEPLNQSQGVSGVKVGPMDLGNGIVRCEISFPEELYYTLLQEKTGFTITSQADLMALLIRLSQVQKQYDRVASALESVEATGYGVVMPSRPELQLSPPELIHKGDVYGVRMGTKASSIHMLRIDLQGEVKPMVGNQRQAQELVDTLAQSYASEPEALWNSNIFGKTVYELVADGLESKEKSIPEELRQKFRSALTRAVNEEVNGMLCLLF